MAIVPNKAGSIKDIVSSKSNLTREAVILGASELKKRKGTGLATTSDFTRTYTSFSGTDMVCIFEIPLPTGGAIVRAIGSVSTITYSIYNTKMPVRVLGNMNASGFVFGQRSIAGTIVFTVFDRHWAQEMMAEYALAVKTKAHFLIDEMPHLNISLPFANEYGQKARLALYGVTFVQEGQVMSLNDIYTENTFQFYATDIDYMTDVVDESSGGNGPVDGGDLPISLNNNERNSSPSDRAVPDNDSNESNSGGESLSYRMAHLDEMSDAEKTSTVIEYAADYNLNEAIKKADEGDTDYVDRLRTEKLDTIKKLYNNKTIDKSLYTKAKVRTDYEWNYRRIEISKYAESIDD